jgi:hypothetical protein
MIMVGEFGEKANPPWDRARALSALIEMDNLDPAMAAKRILDHFGPEAEK